MDEDFVIRYEENYIDELREKFAEKYSQEWESFKRQNSDDAEAFANENLDKWQDFVYEQAELHEQGYGDYLADMYHEEIMMAKAENRDKF